MERRLLDLIGEAYGLLELDAFRPALLEALRRAVPCDWTALNDIGPGPGEVTSLVEPPLPAELHEAFARLANQNPLVRHFLSTRSARAYRMSDVATPAELHATELYREVYAPIGLEFQMAFVLPAPGGHVLGVVLSRRHADFTDEEVAFVELARPHLTQAYRNAREHTALLMRLGRASAVPPMDLRAHGLTRREAEVLRRVAAGRSNADVASDLSLSARTVQKHLENAYRKLGVRSRSEAARIAWTTYDERELTP
jgi:DNA-binding CsgD family transcriptional regulator